MKYVSATGLARRRWPCYLPSMKAIGLIAAVALAASPCSLQVFAQGYTVMDTVYTPTGFPDGPLHATIYIPSSPNGIGVVLAHWYTGTRQTSHAWCEAFAANGYVAMTIDYYDFDDTVKCRYPRPIRAYKTAVEFLRRNAARFGILTGKIVGFGQSEGSVHWGEAITEDNDDTFLGTDPQVDDHVDAAVLLYGSYDNVHFLQSTLDVNGLLTTYFTDYPNFRATKGNCIANFDSIHCPVLLFHGPNDNLLQYQQSLELRDSMAAHQMQVELLSNTSWDHGFDVDGPPNFTFTAQGLVARDSVLAFLHRELIPTSVSVAGQVRVPVQFSLLQNYPNPFNPSTSIRFQILKSSQVKLKVFDIVGREVTTLVDERLQPGSYETTFNAKGLASGVYLYRLQAGEIVQTRKLVLQK